MPTKAKSQNEVNRYFYNIQLCFCENYLAMAELVREAINLKKLVYLLFTKLEYFKKKSELLESQNEDTNAKYRNEVELKTFLASKVKELESSQISTMSEIIQRKKESVLYKEKATELEESKLRLEQENEKLKKVLRKQVKQLKKQIVGLTQENNRFIAVFDELKEKFKEMSSVYDKKD